MKMFLNDEKKSCFSCNIRWLSDRCTVFAYMEMLFILWGFSSVCLSKIGATVSNNMTKNKDVDCRQNFCFVTNIKTLHNFFFLRNDKKK